MTATKKTDTAKLTLKAKKNPHKPGSLRAERWTKLRTGMTVAEAVQAGVPSIYLKRIAKAGHITIGSASAGSSEPKAKAPARKPAKKSSNPSSSAKKPASKTTPKTNGKPPVGNGHDQRIAS